MSGAAECRSVGPVLTPLDTIDTVHAWAVSSQGSISAMLFSCFALTNIQNDRDTHATLESADADLEIVVRGEA